MIRRQLLYLFIHSLWGKVSTLALIEASNSFLFFTVSAIIAGKKEGCKSEELNLSIKSKKHCLGKWKRD